MRALALRLGGQLGPPGPSAMAAMAARLGDNDLAVALEAAAALARLRWRIPGTVPPLLALLARTPDDGAAGALADALAVSASPADDATLAAALRRSPPRGRRWIARALAAAHAAQPLEDGPLVDLLIGALAQGAPEAEAAADALASARGVRGREAAILRAFDAAEPDVRPRLCGAVAALAGAAGRDRLMALVADAGEPPAVRAAAAWALPHARELRRDDLAGAAALRFTLTRAGTATEPALAANARAALAAGASAAGGKTEAHAAWAAVRLVGADGAPLAHQWLTLTAADGTTVWTQSGLDGVARLQALPPGPYQVRLMNPTLALRTSSASAMIAATASGRSPAIMPRPPTAAAARSPAMPWTSTPSRAASSAPIPCASSAPMIAGQDIAGPRRAERRVGGRIDEHRSVGAGGQRARPLEHHDGTRVGRQPARRRHPRRAGPRRCVDPQQARHLARVRRQHARRRRAGGEPRRVRRQDVQRVGVDDHRQRQPRDRVLDQRAHARPGRDRRARSPARACRLPAPPAERRCRSRRRRRRRSGRS